ncbi:MAG: sulfotransferase, partial [Acidimicrobiales bacterium]
MRQTGCGASAPDSGGAGSAPLFIAGPDRSGTTLMYALLASHPDVSMVRRTNMWRYFHGRYGDLAEPANLER